MEKKAAIKSSFGRHYVRSPSGRHDSYKVASDPNSECNVPLGGCVEFEHVDSNSMLEYADQAHDRTLSLQSNV